MSAARCRRPRGTWSASSSGSTTRRLNAHRTTERTLLYPWHPWSGLSIHVHDVTARGSITAFRCSLGGDIGRCLEVPAWMFEQEACVPLVMASQPRVCVGALSALRRLLTEVMEGRRTDALASAAEGDSPDQSRGEVHATPPREASAPSSTTQPVRPPSRGGASGHGGLVGAARGDAADPDRPVGAPAPRARGQGAARRRSP